MYKAQHTTPYIKHLAQSVYFKVSRFNKNHKGLIGLCFEMPNVSYTSTLEHIIHSISIIFNRNSSIRYTPGQLKLTLISSSILLKPENYETEKKTFIDLVAYVVNKVVAQPEYKF